MAIETAEELVLMPENRELFIRMKARRLSLTLLFPSEIKAPGQAVYMRALSVAAGLAAYQKSMNNKAVR